jgi:ATP-dependent Clp protease ATP-binding subunit ClpX
MEKVELELTDNALVSIAKQAIKRKTGARGLRAILENVLIDTMYELPDHNNLEKVIINEEVIDKKAQPVLINKA